MAEYYLVSQLPSLDSVSDNLPIPITEERFLELCNRYLGKNAQKELSKLTLMPPKKYEKSSSNLIEAWNNGERNLRLALAKFRAEKMNKSYDIQNQNFPAAILQAARTAVEMENPMETELFLNLYRLNFLESLRPFDTFAEDFVYYYGLKLKLILRIREFNAENGNAAYRNIYNSIINGDRLEALQ